MARPIKDGVAYFPKDADFYTDDKVRILRGEFGAKGMYLLDYLLCDVYGKNGYFIQWGEDKCCLVSDGAGCGCTPTFVAEFVTGCVRCSFFDKRVFDVFGVLTSAGIQRRYIRGASGRAQIRMYKEFWLLDERLENDVPTKALGKVVFASYSPHEKRGFLCENPEKTADNPQKEKQKEKEIKIQRNTAPAPALGRYRNVLLTKDELRQLGEEFSDLKERIEALSEYMASTGKKYKSHAATLRAWARRDAQKNAAPARPGGINVDAYERMVERYTPRYTKKAE